MAIGMVLAGGRARRLGGRHKPAIVLGGGVTLLDRAVAALADMDRIVVVGPRQPTSPGGPPLVWTREDPPGTGPVAALAAGLGALGPIGPDTEIVVLAADLPAITAATVRRLRAALAMPGLAGAVLRDGAGRRQWLVSAWRAGPLVAALPVDPAGRPLHATLSALPAADVPELPGESADIDTPADLERLMGAPIRGEPSHPSH